jgi:regulator of protease activity HflC (stomatin/prohibitin superfamily)
MLFMTVTTCAFMLPCAPIQSPSAVTRNNAPPQMLNRFTGPLEGFSGGKVIVGGGGGGGGGDQTAVAVTAAAFALVIFSSTFDIVQPGQVGIVTTLGSMSPIPVQAGFRFKSPLANTETFSLKTTLTEESTTVPTKEGLSIELDTALLYRLEPEKVQSLILSVGRDYERVVIKPEVRSIIRGLTSQVEAKALYTSGRGELQQRLKDDLSEALGARGIIVEDVLLKSVKLPDQLTRAVELKAESEQAAQRMEFVLAKERQEAERKKIEASGIADFQSIVSKGISPELLKWKGIEATERLAESSNSKLVIMGNGKDQLPVILNGAGST